LFKNEFRLPWGKRWTNQALESRLSVDTDGHRLEADAGWAPRASLAGPQPPQGIAPSLTISVGAPNSIYFENSGAKAIAPTLLVSDADSPNFAGGTLTVSFSGATAAEMLGIANQGTGAGLIGVSGSNVTYGGVSIGTFSGGAGGSISVSLNAAATAEAVQALGRDITYTNSSDNPGTFGCVFTFALNDGSATGQVTSSLMITALDDAPTAANLAGDVAQYAAGAAAVRLDQGTAVTLADVDNSDFGHGSLSVRVFANGVAGQDALGVMAGDPVSIAGGFVTVNGINIGSVTGAGTMEMTFSFNATATIPLVTALVHALSYSNNSNNPANLQRSLQIDLVDGHGLGGAFGDSDKLSVQVFVNVTGSNGVDPPPPPPGSVPPSLTYTPVFPADLVMSDDGLRLYTAGSDGNVRIYRGETGDLLSTIHVANSLNAIDVSPNGRFLFVTDTQIVSTSPPGTSQNNVITTIACYRIDLVTQQITRFTLDVHGFESTFADVAILDDGRVLFSERVNASGPTAPLRLLNPATGQFSDVGIPTDGATLIRTADGTHVLAGASSNSTMPAGVFDSHLGVVARQSTSGLGRGIEAYSPTASLIVGVDEGGLYAYGASLALQGALTQFNPQWQSGNVQGLAFDATGTYLFVLDRNQDAIVQLAVADWSIIHSIPLGINVFGGATLYGNSLMVSPDMRYFTVASDRGVQRVDNPYVADAVVGTMGVDVMIGTGNGETIIGDGGNDQIDAGGGADKVLGGDNDDILHGGDGNDVVQGGWGNDTLYGDAGADRLEGGWDNDSYYVDAGDLIVEKAGQGIDSVFVSASFALPAGLEIEALATANPLGTSAINLTGNDFAQQIVGNAGNNILDGAGGADVMTGGAGDDIYLVDAADLVVENAGGGTDEIRTSLASYSIAALGNVENLTGSSAGRQTLTGNDGANVLRSGGHASMFGDAGDDRLVGGAGADVFTGGAGADTFAFLAPADSHEAVYRSDGRKFVPDLITDFHSGEGDRIDLSAIDAVAGTPGNDAFAFIGGGAFTGHAGELRWEIRGGAAIVFADIDGDGSGDFQFLVFTPALAASDFVL